MLIGLRKPNSDYFVLKNIQEPLTQGWRISDCGKMAVSLTTRYYCDGLKITESPVKDVAYQLFGCVGDTYVYYKDTTIPAGDLHYMFHFGIENFNLLPADVITAITNNLNIAGVSR